MQEQRIDLKDPKVLDVYGFSNCEISAALSNMAHHPFEIDGVQCGSMEGFVQSLKFKEPERQLEVASKVGIKARELGVKRNWKVQQTLYWKGTPFSRHSEGYQILLDNAYDAMYIQSKEFREALTKSKGRVLLHLVGNTDPFKTIMTQEEFLCRLNRLRSL